MNIGSKVIVELLQFKTWIVKSKISNSIKNGFISILYLLEKSFESYESNKNVLLQLLSENSEHIVPLCRIIKNFDNKKINEDKISNQNQFENKEEFINEINQMNIENEYQLKNEIITNRILIKKNIFMIDNNTVDQSNKKIEVFDNCKFKNCNKIFRLISLINSTENSNFM